MANKVHKNPGSQPRDTSERERRFIEAFMGPAQGNRTEAARIAGFKGNRQVLGVTGKTILDRPRVRAEIERRTAEDPAVLDRKKLQLFWSALVRGEGKIDPEPDANGFRFMGQFGPKERIKASELLGKSQAVFVERVELSGKDGAPIVIAQDLTKLSFEELKQLEALAQKITPAEPDDD